jgi:hypothetical protein
MLLILRRVRHNYHGTRPFLSQVLAITRCRLIDMHRRLIRDQKVAVPDRLPAFVVGEPDSG